MITPFSSSKSAREVIIVSRMSISSSLLFFGVFPTFLKVTLLH